MDLLQPVFKGDHILPDSSPFLYGIWWNGYFYESKIYFKSMPRKENQEGKKKNSTGRI